jgi:hypothetical protein
MTINGIEFLDIPGWEGEYAVSNNGIIYSLKRNKFMKLFVSDGGYLCCKFCRKSITYKVSVGVLVARAWIGPPPFKGACVLHRDDNKMNNHVSNLYYGTRADNSRDRVRNGLARGPKGEKNGMVQKAIKRQKSEEGERIRVFYIEFKTEWLHSGTTLKDLAKKHDIAYLFAHAICNKKTWVNFTDRIDKDLMEEQS